MEQLEGSSRGRPRFVPSLRLEDSLSLAAFVMSLAITLINVYYSMRGSEIAVEQPTQLILFRDGKGEAAVLTAAIRLELMNTSDSYGDVLRKASLSLNNGKSAFESQATIRPVLTDEKGTVPDCELGLRCIRLPGLYVIEKTDEILETPAASARVFTLGFPIVGWNCTGTGDLCGTSKSFDSAVSALERSPLRARLSLKFHSDGERTIRCNVSDPDLAYLRKVGWMSVHCEKKAA